MPDAMDVAFQTALEYGKSGAVSITICVSLMVYRGCCLCFPIYIKEKGKGLLVLYITMNSAKLSNNKQMHTLHA